jgi:hypothetical protein
MKSMSPEEMLSRFDALQTKLVPLWQMIGRSDPGGPVQEENTVVVIPSLTADVKTLGTVHQVYEERFLFMLFLLRQPRLKMIYLTSQAILPDIVEYYLQILPGVMASHARKRLALLSPLDASPRPLVEKLLERPRLLQHIRSLIPDPDRAHMVPFVTTDLERELAVRLDIPMYAADPRYFAFGTKSGGRRLFAEEGVQHPLGIEDLTSEEALVAAVASIRAQKPAVSQVIVKLNEGVSGMGNAVANLQGLPSPGDPTERAAVANALRAMRFEVERTSYDWYVGRVQAKGAIVEEMISGEEVHSPSVQMRISPLGQVEILSTHDQMLGGPSGQSYLGAIFPANPNYSPLITHEAAKVGERFAREGIIGRFALDFLVVRSAGGEWQPYAIEINLRKGGTTAPYLTLQYLTDGCYDPEAGLFSPARGGHRFYVSSDHVESDAYRTFTPEDLFDLVSSHRMHFDHCSQTGLVLHMFSGVGELGQLGVTAIGHTAADARALYQRFVDVLDSAA